MGLAFLQFVLKHLSSRAFWVIGLGPGAVPWSESENLYGLGQSAIGDDVSG